MTPLVYAWPGHEALAAALASAMPAETGRLTLRRFPDGETYVRLLSAPEQRHVVFACGLEHPDEKCTSLYFAASTARELGALSVGLVSPYLAYMRQDARFNDGEAVASRVFAHWLSATVDWLVTLDPHLHRHAALSEIYTIPTAVASSTAAISRWIGANVHAPLVIGPDAESAQWVSAVAAGAGCPYLVLQKTRHGDRDVDIALPAIAPAWRERTPVLVDDIISTARTLAAAVARLRAANMPAPVCVGVHALFCGDALQVLQTAGAGQVATCNSIAHPTNAIDVLPEIARAARGLVATTHAHSA
ncbi:MAG TPA: ribose-phosphate diphosphokinase [Rudaea sp.]|nr:ribose-phosphate diphosphokinase [Rudaea sp.]